MLLDLLINDEKKIDKDLYSSGPYWNYKNKKTINEIKKKGLNNFRGLESGVGSSFTDNITFDIGNELNFKGKIIRYIFTFPILKKIFNAQLSITKNHIDNYLQNKSIVYKYNNNVKELLENFKFQNTTEFGCIETFVYEGKKYSILYLEMADRIKKLSKKFNFKNIKSYFEIGGGFGANIHFLLTNYQNIKKIIYLDACPNIYVGTEYLKFHYGEKVKDYSALRDLDEIRFSNNDELEIFCIPPWLIEKLNIKIDHFHNAASFVEMPKKVVENYIKFIKKFSTKDISLISYDRFDTQTTFDPEDLNLMFDKKLNIAWEKSLIEDYERKNVYLTSN